MIRAESAPINPNGHPQAPGGRLPRDRTGRGGQVPGNGLAEGSDMRRAACGVRPDPALYAGSEILKPFGAYNA